MALPGFTADVSLGGASDHRPTGTALAVPTGAGQVTPQLTLCTPCVQVGGEPWCVTILGRRLCLPTFGRWKGCCWTRWGWPPVACNIRAC